MQTIIPILRYQNARAAIQWLSDAFGFVQLFSVPESGFYVRHAQLQLGTNIVMVGSVRPDDGLSSPLLSHAPTQALCVNVPDVQGLFQRASTAGAACISSPAVSDVGFLECHVRDLEGHPWIFTSFPQARP